MLYLELVSGLRKSELVVLLWDDLDIQNRTISVSKQYIKNPSGTLTLSHPRLRPQCEECPSRRLAIDLVDPGA